MASIFDYACTLEGACYILTTHPQTIGRAHMIQMYEQLINYMAERGACSPQRRDWSQLYP